MTVFALFYFPDRDSELLLGLYESEDDLKEDVRILEDIDKLVSNLHNKNVHPQHTGDNFHYGCRKIEIALHKEKGGEK